MSAGWSGLAQLSAVDCPGLLLTLSEGVCSHCVVASRNRRAHSPAFLTPMSESCGGEVKFSNSDFSRNREMLRVINNGRISEQRAEA